MKKVSEMIYSLDGFPYAKKNILGGGAGFDPHAVNLFLQDLAVLAEENEKTIEELLTKIEAYEEQEELGVSISGEQEVEDDEIVSLKEELKSKYKQADIYEKAFKKMVLSAEQMAEDVREEAREEAKKIIKEAQMKATSLIKEANNRYEEKSREIEKLEEKIDELKTIAQYILNQKNNKESAI